MKLTWKKNKKKRSLPAVSLFDNLPFEQQPCENVFQQEDAPSQSKKDGEDGDQGSALNPDQSKTQADREHSDLSEARQLAKDFQAQGEKLAEDGKYREALGKWEAALTLMPKIAVLHEQKAQVLLEIGDAWNALKAAARATELEPSWAEAWVTLGRAQLNFGEPDSAIESFDRALAIKPDYEEARDDRKTASLLVKKRKQLHSSGLSTTKYRYVVGDKDENS